MADKHLKILAENLSKFRARNGKSLKEVAEAIGITYNALSTYEKGSKFPPLEFVIRLAEYYDVSLDELCGLQKGIWGSSDSRECMQAYITLRKMGFPQEVNVKQVSWHEWKGRLEPEQAAEFSAREELDDDIQMFRKTVFTIHNDSFSRFVEAYEKMHGLVEEELIDEQIFSEWLEKRLSELPF